MLFNDLMANACMYLNLKSGCNETMTQINNKYHISDEIDKSETYVSKHFERETYDLFGKKTVEYTLNAGIIANSIMTKTVQFKTPFKPLADELQFNGKSNEWSLNANWKWNLP